MAYRRDFPTRTEARTLIFDQIKAFYNCERSHGALNYCPPAGFELKNNELTNELK